MFNQFISGGGGDQKHLVQYVQAKQQRLTGDMPRNFEDKRQEKKALLCNHRLTLRQTHNSPRLRLCLISPFACFHHLCNIS